MITNFQAFGLVHIISILSAVFIGVVFIVLATKLPQKLKVISLLFAITIFIIRAIRYVFDIKIGTFSPIDLLSPNVCNIDLYILLICLLKPNRKLFTFVFLIGIPTALSVALMPGKIHPDPGLARAVLFIMSHMMLVMGALFLQLIYRFKITTKDLKFYYIISAIGIILVYIFDRISNSNFMYLTSGPKGTILASLFEHLGPVFYVFAIYLLLISLFSGLYFISKKIKNLSSDKIA